MYLQSTYIPYQYCRKYVTDRSPNANVVKENNGKCQMILISFHKFEQDQLRWHHFQYHHYDCVLDHQVIQSLHSKSLFLEVLPNSKKNHQRYTNENCTKAMDDHLFGIHFESYLQETSKSSGICIWTSSKQDKSNISTFYITVFYQMLK